VENDTTSALLNERINSLRQLLDERDRLHQQAVELSAAKTEANNTSLKREAVLSQEFRANINGRMVGVAITISCVFTLLGLYLSYLLVLRTH
jgi:hypothetical protein